MNFLDTEAEATSARAELEKHLLTRIVLKDRYSKPTEFRLGVSGKRSLATVSSRGNAAFELFPGALNKLQLE